MFSEDSLRVGRRDAPAESADWTGVIMHKMEHGIYRRGQPYTPPPKPVLDENAVMPGARGVSRGGFNQCISHNKPDELKKVDRLPRGALAKKVVMSVVRLLADGYKPNDISISTGLTTKTINRINNRGTITAVKCWEQLASEKRTADKQQ